MGNKEGSEFTEVSVNNEVVKIMKDGLVGTAITELGGVVTGVKKIDDPKAEEAPKEGADIIRETMPGGSKEVITENGSRYNPETSDLILKGSND